MSSADEADLAPINATYSEVDRWLKANGPAAAALAGSVAYAPTFSDQSFPAGIEEVRDLWTSGGWVSWLGGPAVAPLQTWPTAASGLPLAHVITVCLEDLHGVCEAKVKAGWPLHEESLPTAGALEVFHDLRTFGQEAGDGAAGAWLVRWTPTPDRSLLIQGPDTSALDGYPSSAVCQAGTFLPGWNLPAVSDFAQASVEVFDTVQDLREGYGRAWMAQRQITYRGGPYNVTHAYGHAQHASSTAQEVLSVVLPLAEGGRHRLLLDIESYTHLSGWFGDLGNLQVWIRQSDLEGCNFDAAWCMIRTD